MTDDTGANLIELGLRQGSYIRCSDLPDTYREHLPETRPLERHRKKPIPSNAVLAVMSQDCDIAAKNDSEPAIELSLFKPVKPKDESFKKGQQFAQSTRHLTIYIEDNPYSAYVWHTVWISKEEALELLNGIEIFELKEKEKRALVQWRSLRYCRAAFPDNFNTELLPILNNYREQVFERSQYIIDVLISLNSYQEEEEYLFSLIAIVLDETPDKDQHEIRTTLENLVDELDRVNHFYSCYLNECSIDGDKDIDLEHCIEAQGVLFKESEISLRNFLSYKKINLDYISIKKDEPISGA